MTVTAHVYQIYINADADRVWSGITESEWKRRYFHGTSYAEGPTPGARYRTVTANGGDAIDGMIEEMTPPGPGTPGRFVQTWHVLYDADLAAEPPSRVEWTVEQVANRWISKYAARFTSALVGLQQHVEGQDPTHTEGTAS